MNLHECNPYAFVLVALLGGSGSLAADGGLQRGLPIKVEIRLVDSDVLLGEPVGVDLLMLNVGEKSVVVSSRLDVIELTAEISLHHRRISTERIAPADMLMELHVPDLELGVGSALARRIILEKDSGAGSLIFADPGQYRIKMKLGPGYESNGVDLTVRSPMKREAAALADLEARAARLERLPIVTTENRLAWLDARDHEDREFIREFRDTVYANHRRLALAENLMVDYTNYRAARIVEASDLLEFLIDSKPPFAFTDQALLRLLECYRRSGKTAGLKTVETRLLTGYPNSALMVELLSGPMRPILPH